MSKKYLPLSHPPDKNYKKGKPLVDHEKGVLSKCDINDLLLLIVVFHDVGKMNDNFQKKIMGKPFDGYSHHSYISAYYLINAFVNNERAIMKRFSFINKDNYDLILLILLNVIIGHHGCLRNIDDLFNNEEEWDNMIEYLKTIKMTNHVRTFFRHNPDLLNCKLRFADKIEKSDYYKSYGSVDGEMWRDNALDNYFTTLYGYSELVNGDRRDASGNLFCYRNKNEKIKYANNLDNGLIWTYRNFKEKSALNDARNEIRNMAVNKLRKCLETGNDRIFTLTAPTSSGKTFMMLQLALEILKKFNNEHDIIYALPYLSIIDQTIKIVNDNLRIETLNYTSASDSSIKLQELIERKELNNNDNSKELIEYAFSENCFDHPFIITTFNQLFESLLNNSTSKVMRLKNFKKRIFLIDEYQATSPTQYYFMVQLLNEFCKRHDCYAIISTATMPRFDINLNWLKNRDVKKLFKNSIQPMELLPKEIFNYNVFNRYIINFMGEVNPTSLYNMVNNSKVGTLLIVNTIRTSQRMYFMFANENSNFEKVYLLNAHITPSDRKLIIDEVKKDLAIGRKILLVSTQVIEAGVDISFPTLYRDAAPPSGVVQASGRNNRNGEFGITKTYLFLYKDPEQNGRYDCEMVYHSAITKIFRDDIKNKIAPMTEHEFHERCNKYFQSLSWYSEVGKVNEDQNLVNNILDGDFLKIGKFRFIQGDPDTSTIYVGEDNKWNDYVKLYNEMQLANGYSDRDNKTIDFKNIRGYILQNSINIRQKVFVTLLVDQYDIFGVFKLLDKSRYSPKTGLREI